MAVIGLISPGQMGTGIARAAQDNFHEIIWASQGRSERTKQRADKYGFRDVVTLEEMARQTKYILCVGFDNGNPNNWSIETLDRVGEAGFRGVYCDANTKPSERKHVLETNAKAHGISYIDGAIFGNPPPQGKVVRAFQWIPIKGDPQFLKMVFSAAIGAFNSISVLANRSLDDPELVRHLVAELMDGAFDHRVDGKHMGLFPGW